MALASILFLYFGIGVLAALGTVAITQKYFSPRTEHRFFALLLVPIALIYLTFTSYFQSPSSVRFEGWAIIVFAALGLLGTRVPWLILIGFVLHGGWDLGHEVLTYRGQRIWEGMDLTPIPLAYGVFCAAYDWCIAGYIYLRRGAWRTGRPSGL